MAESVVLEETIDESYEPTEEEIEEYAKWLGIDLENDKHLFWVAKQGLKAPLPPEWKPCQSPDGELYYFNFENGESVWDHPCDDYYRNMYKEEKAKNPRPAPSQEAKKGTKKRPKPTGGKGSSSGGGGGGGPLKAVVAPRERSNLSAAADLLGPLKTPSVAGGLGGGGNKQPVGGIGVEKAQKKGLLSAGAALGGGGGTGSSQEAAGAGASAEARQKEFAAWSAEQRKQHEAKKASIAERAQAKTNSAAEKQLNETTAARIRKIRLETDKLRAEKLEIESRSPAAKGSGSREGDALEKTRNEMTIQMERTKLEQELKVAELEEKAKLADEEKQAVEQTTSAAESEQARALQSLQSEHDAAVVSADAAYQRAKERAAATAADCEQLSQQQESTLLLAETERYTTELQKALQDTRASAEAEVEERLAAAKTSRDEEYDEQIKAERVKMDAEREQALAKVTADMEAAKTEALRKVSSGFAAGDGGGQAAAAALDDARAKCARDSAKAISTLEDRLDMERKEVRQGLPAAELQLKTQLASELDEMDNEFRAQLESEKSADVSKQPDDDEEIKLPASKESDLRKWQEEHERASQQGIAAEVAELKEKMQSKLKATVKGITEAGNRRVETEAAHVAGEDHVQVSTDGHAKQLAQVKKDAEEANRVKLDALRSNSQSDLAAKVAELEAKLQAEQAMTATALQAERNKAEQALAAVRARVARQIEQINANILSAEQARADQHGDHVAARLLHAALEVAAAAAPGHDPADEKVVSAAKEALDRERDATRKELSALRERHAAEVSAIEAELQSVEISSDEDTSDLHEMSLAAEQAFEHRCQEFERQAAEQEAHVREEARERSEQARKASLEQLADLERQLARHQGAAVISSVANQTASQVARELAAAQSEEQSLTEMVQLASQELLRSQAELASQQQRQKVEEQDDHRGAAAPLRHTHANQQRPQNTRPAPKSNDRAFPKGRPIAWAADEAGQEAVRLDSERRKLERARAAVKSAARALQERQVQWVARRDEWLADMRTAKRAGRSDATEYLREVKMAIEEQADALNAEARELNRKKKQIKAMKQEIRDVENATHAARGKEWARGGSVSDTLRTIEVDLQQVQRAIHQHHNQVDRGANAIDIRALERKWAEKLVH